MLIDSLLRSTLAWLLVLTFISVGVAENRTWTDATGKHRVEAEFLKIVDGQVTLLRTDGREVTLPLTRLSAKDRAYIVRLPRARRTNAAEETKDEAAGEHVTDQDEVDADVVASDDGNQFKVPDGNARKLLEFIVQLQAIKPPTGGDAETNAAFHRDVQLATVEAADKILGRRARKQEIAMAVGAKLNALSLLTRMSRDPTVEKIVQAFPAQLRKLNQPRLAKSAETLVIDHQLATARTEPQVKAAVDDVRQHLSDFGKLTGPEIALARAAGRASQRLGPEFAAATYKELAELLMETPTAQEVGQSMLGTARRLGLVGNEMHLVGFTSENMPFDLQQYKGKVVLVDFWATWCGPCMAEMPNIRRNFEKYHDRGFEVVAVSVDTDLEALQQYIVRESPPWTVLVDRHPRNKQAMSAYYAISGIPTTILVGPEGKVLLLSCRGQRLGKELERLLGGSES